MHGVDPVRRLAAKRHKDFHLFTQENPLTE